MSVLERLQNWYDSQCNGDWEHLYGVFIENLDNPGWMVTIDLIETELEDKNFDEILDERTESNWLDCRVEEKKFRGMGGSFNLIEILEIFLIWAESEKSS